MSHLRRIEVYLRKTNTPPTRFGREVARDPRLVFDLRMGRSVGASLGARIDAYINQVSQ